MADICKDKKRAKTRTKRIEETRNGEIVEKEEKAKEEEQNYNILVILLHILTESTNKMNEVLPFWLRFFRLFRKE